MQVNQKTKPSQVKSVFKALVMSPRCGTNGSVRVLRKPFKMPFKMGDGAENCIDMLKGAGGITLLKWGRKKGAPEVIPLREGGRPF